MNDSNSTGRVNKKRINLADKEIAKRLKDLRVDLNYSQEDLADYLNISQRQIWDYENAKARISAQSLIRIAEFLHKPVSYFYGEEKDILTRLEKKLDIIFNIFIDPEGDVKEKLELNNDIGLKDFLIFKGISNQETLNDLEIYFRFACDRDNFNFDNIWYT